MYKTRSNVSPRRKVRANVSACPAPCAPGAVTEGPIGYNSEK